MVGDGSGSGTGGTGSGGGVSSGNINGISGGRRALSVPPSLPPLNVHIAAIVTATVNAATRGILAATAKNASVGMDPTQAPLSQLKLLYLRIIYGVATNDGIPTI